MNYPREKTIHQVFEEQVDHAPDAVALIAGDQRLSYAQLNAKANRLAHRLIALGVLVDDLVGVLMDRSPEMIISILGILKAGGAYLPLDPKYPVRRLAFMAKDAGVEVIVTQSRLADLAPRGVAHVIRIDSSDSSSTDRSTDNPLVSMSASNLAYVNYTSGSTGEPKGVEVPHRAVVRLVVNTNYVHVKDSDAFLHLSAFSFDATTFEIWGALLNGARCVLLPEGIPTIEALKSAIRTHRITILWLTASLFNAIIDEDPDTLVGIEQLLIGGEALSVDHVRRALKQLPSTQIINGYGPTEGTTFTCCHIIPRELPAGATSIPLGRPVANTEVFVMDDAQRPVPAGVPGELFIGGDGLARGYLNRPELTRERFVPHPFSDSPEARLYRTGDRVRCLPDGTLEFIGRMDDQLKLHGFRIEPGEVEAVLKTHEEIRDALVLPVTRPSGDAKLVAWVIAVNGAHPSSSDVGTFLADRLPAYMVPSSFVFLDRFPLTDIGKVDRAALRLLTPDRRKETHASERPRNTAEQTLARIWSEVLGPEQIGIHEDFFELGGDSLLATRVISRVRSAVGANLEIRNIFDQPTIVGLARVIEATGGDTVGPETSRVRPAPRDQELPLSFSQRQLWFLNRLHPDSPAYNEPVCVRLTGPLNVAALKSALNEVVARHEALRTQFSSINGRPVQSAQKRVVVDIALDSLIDVPERDRDQELQRRLSAEARRPFQLDAGPLIRTRLFRLDDDDHVFLMTLHHIVCDGWSLDILFKELSILYDAHDSGRLATLPDLPIQYADFAVWQRQEFGKQGFETHLKYWRKHLADAPATMQLPLDHPRASASLQDGATRSIELSRELSESLSSLSQDHGASLFMTLLSAFEILLQCYTDQEDMVVGCPIAGRNQHEIEPLIGYFVNTLPVRANLAGDPTFLELLGRTREATLAGHEHQELPLEILVEDLQPQRRLGATPFFQAVLVLQSALTQSLELPGLTVLPVPVDCGAAKFDLTMIAEESARGLKVAIEYRTALFEQARIDTMLDHFHELLRRIAVAPERHLSELATGIEPLRSALPWKPGRTSKAQARAANEVSRTTVEHALTRIWGELLGRNVGPNDDFFDLGGHSLLAIRLFARIEKDLGIELPVSVLFENPTVGALSEVLRNHSGLDGEDSIATIRGGGTGTPIYLLPSLGGELFASSALTDHLPLNHSIHGFHFSGPEIDGVELGSIEMIAAAFVKDLLRFQPNGSCCLIGYSFGGAVAFEVARQLSTAGRSVEPLVLIDSGVRAANGSKAGLHTEFARFLRNLPFWTWDVLFKSSPRDIMAYISRKVKALGRQHLRGGGEVASDIFDLSEVPEAHIRRMDSNLRALVKYRGQSYPGRITLFRGRARPLLQSHENDLGWGFLAQGGVDVRVLPCSHDDIMEESHIRQLSGQIAELLGDTAPGGASK